MAGRLRVEWTRRAVKDVDRIFVYLQKNWTDREVKNFLEQLKRFEELIAQWPRSFKRSAKHKYRRLGLVHRHTTAVYRVYRDRIVIITVFDNRSEHG